MSALFNEWSYYDAFDTSPITKATPEPILPEVARLSVEVPDPEVRVRSFTVTCPSRDSREAPLAKKPEILHAKLDTPLTRKQAQTYWNLRQWLGAQDPALYDFDKRLWEMETQQFHVTCTDANLAARLALEAKSHAGDVEREIKWLLHELEDTCDRDLASLKLATSHINELNAKQNEATEVKEAISLVWDSLNRCANLLKGPAPKAIPHILRIMQDADAALKFCNDHSGFFDIESTAEQWKSLALRALAITTAYVSHELRKVTLRCASLVKQSQGGAGATQALIYTKFESDSQSLVPFISLLREHSYDTRWLSGFQGFADLQFTYFQLRSSLVKNCITEYLTSLQGHTSISDEFIDSARETLVHFQQLYANEEQIFTSLFGNLTVEFVYWIEDISEPLYALMRRLIVHSTDIGKLCQVIVLVQKGNNDNAESNSVDNDKTTNSMEKFSTKSATVKDSNTPMGESMNEPNSVDSGENGQRRNYFDTIHKDAQNRLIFRANILVDEYVNFVPSPKDFSLTKFPIVDQTLTLLRQVFQLLSSHVFNELAHRCVRECLACLDKCVANRVASNTTSDLKIHLFHIKQLLILQSQIVDFDLKNTVVQEIDFSGIQKLLAQYKAGQGFRELLYQAWDSVPRVVEIMFDAMEEIFVSLRRSVQRLCESFTLLLDFDLTRDTDNQARKLRSTIIERFEQLNQGIIELIGEHEIHAFLLDSVQEKVLDMYTNSYRQLSYFGEETENLMDIDTMTAWLSTVIPKVN